METRAEEATIKGETEIQRKQIKQRQDIMAPLVKKSLTRKAVILSAITHS